MLPDAAGLLLLGMISGATVCSLSCLPVLGTFLLACPGGFRDGFRVSALFVSGKLLSYALAGGIAGFLGQFWAVDQGSTAVMSGLLLVAAGLLLPWMQGRRCGASVQSTRGGAAAALGFLSSLAPCPPLLAVFVEAARSGSVAGGIGAGLLYGSGLLLSPLLLFGGAVGFLGQRISHEAEGFAPYLRGMAGLLMVAMGVRFLLSS